MRFHVGPHIYRLRIGEQPIIDAKGELMGMCCEAERTIILSPKVPAQSRLVMLVHELAHAWAFHTGEPSHTEDWCNLCGTVFSSTLADLNAQGGVEALMRLEPGESPSSKAAAVALTRNRYCARCEGTVAGASVACRPSDVPGVLDLALYCEHCGHVQRWKEAAAVSGQPSGAVVGEARFERDEAASAFLRQQAGGGAVLIAAE